MWESPVYKFAKKIRENGKLRELVIDVTGSAPTMDEPGETLERVFEVLTERRRPGKTKIIDIGAAKLRNSLYLLEKGFLVYAVEFPELAKRMPQAKANWDRARRYPNFKRLVFPKDFFDLRDKVDIALMINVTNVMPIPKERLTLLALTREKMKKYGLLLWYNWRDPTKYTDKMKVNDGFFKGKGRRHKTFYGEWNRVHVFEMLVSTGFSHYEGTQLPEVGSQAYVFRPDQPIILGKYLDLASIKKGGHRTDPDQPIPETKGTYFPAVYVEELGKVRPGTAEQAKFHRLSARLIANIFDHQLKNPVIEKEINEGRGRIDIRFLNRNEPGFFKNVKDMRNVFCPAVFVECKNYASEIGNPEFDQLSGRLNDTRGLLGLLVCREIRDRAKVLKHCQDRLKAHVYLIVLDDEDLKNLSRKKLDSNEAVDDYMEDKLEKIVD